MSKNPKMRVQNFCQILYFPSQQLPVPVLHSARSGTRKTPTPVEFCTSCRRHLPKIKFKSSKESTAAAAAAGETGGSAGEGRPATTGTVSIGKCVNCERLDNNARTRQDLSVYKSMLNRIRRDEESRFNMTSPIFQLQVGTIRNEVHVIIIMFFNIIFF